MIDDGTFFDQSNKNYIKTYNNIRTITIDQGDDYTTGYLLDYTYFKENYKLVAIDVSKKILDADPKALQQTSFIKNVIEAVHTSIFVITEEGRKTVLDFAKQTVRVL